MSAAMLNVHSVALEMAARRERSRYMGALVRRLFTTLFSSQKAKSHAARTHCPA
jgi:hypothetical protein